MQCRSRIEQRLRDASDPRVARAEERLNNELARQLEAAAQHNEDVHGPEEERDAKQDEDDEELYAVGVIAEKSGLAPRQEGLSEDTARDPRLTNQTKYEHERRDTRRREIRRIWASDQIEHRTPKGNLNAHP